MNELRFTKQRYLDLRARALLAKMAGHTGFWFQDEKFDMEYAEYLLAFLRTKIDKGENDVRVNRLG